MSQLLIITAKRAEEWTGPLDGAIERAREIDAEYRGVRIEDEDGRVVWDSEYV